MDFFFEDEADEVGSDVEAYCPKCRADTTHVVISKYEDEIRRVQCNPCGDVHSFRKPRGEVEEDMPEPAAVKKRATAKKLTWEEFFAKHSEKNAKPYEFRETYRENTILMHPKFGAGFVSEILPDNKVEATFKDGRRFLVHNRKDIPGLPLAAEGDGTPTPKPSTKASKAGKGSAGKGAAPVKAALVNAGSAKPGAIAQKTSPEVAKASAKSGGTPDAKGGDKASVNPAKLQKAPQVPAKAVGKASAVAPAKAPATLPAKAAAKAPPKAAAKAPVKTAAKKPAGPQKPASKPAKAKAAKKR